MMLSNYLHMCARQWKYHFKNVNIVKVEAFYIEYQGFNKWSAVKYVSTVIGICCACKDILFTGRSMSQSERKTPHALAYRWRINQSGIMRQLAGMNGGQLEARQCMQFLLFSPILDFVLNNGMNTFYLTNSDI